MDHELADSTDALSQHHPWAVHQCPNGCVHVQMHNVTLTFTPAEFAAFAELVGKAFVRMSVRVAIAAAGAH